MLAFLLVAGGFDNLLTRNMLPIWMAAAVAVAAGFAARRRALVGLFAAAALCGMGVASTIAIASDRNYQRPDWRGVARRARRAPRSRAPPGDPRPALPRPAAAVAVSAGAAVHEPPRRDRLGAGRGLVHLAAERRLLLVGLGLQPVALAVQAAYAIPGFRPGVAPAGRPVHGPAHRRDRRPRHVSPAAVSRALRTTNYRNDELLIQR